MFKKLVLLAISMVLAVPCFATDELIKTDPNRRAVMAGVTDDASLNVVNLRVDPTSKRLLISPEPATTLYVQKVTITSAGAAARTQAASHAVNSCTVKAASGNAGPVYVGTSTVTNLSGVAEGFDLDPGDGLGPITVPGGNANAFYFATDNANDVVKVFCN